MMNSSDGKPHVVVIGAGFTGLAAAYEISCKGIPVIVLEKDDQIGGLAGSFPVRGQLLEKFYHHWFKSDEHVIQLARELNCEGHLMHRPTRTGMWLNEEFFKLSTPFDVLRFKPLSLLNRIRLGLLVSRARRVKDWKELESLSAEEWLLRMCGPEVYHVVWEPLLRGKFGPFASEVSAVWFWNKLVLRGGSRDKTGKEVLIYYRGGFGAFAERIANKIESSGGLIQTGVPVKGLVVRDGRVKGIRTHKGTINAYAVIATPAFPIIADLLEPHVSSRYIRRLRRVKYLANVCLVLELCRSLSDIYWLNVIDKDFPFIGVIEHTNFQSAETYGGRHIVYLSKYLLETAKLYGMNEEQVMAFSLPHIKRMYPEFDRSWVLGYHVWKARYAQPVVESDYSHLISPYEMPVKGLYIATMAQIYPEDRGTNYAIREGRRIGRKVINWTISSRSER